MNNYQHQYLRAKYLFNKCIKKIVNHINFILEIKYKWKLFSCITKTIR